MPPRVKRFTPKVKSGCKTCKKRRVKCDEGRPSCQRCIRGNFRCEGYTQYDTSLFILDERTKADQERSLLVSRLAKTLQPVLYQCSIEEHRSLIYYLEITAPHISKESTTRVGFWTSTLPQISHEDVAVKHALTAMALSDEAMSSASSFEGIEQRRDSHYAATLHHLINGSPTIESTLLTCAVLFPFECFRRTAMAAEIHALNGQRIVQEYKKRLELGHRPSQNHDLIIDVLQPFFNDALRYVRAVFPSTNKSLYQKTISNDSSSSNDSQNKKPFKTLLEAQQKLTSIIRDLTRVNDESELASTVERLEIWHEPFDKMPRKPPSATLRPTVRVYQTTKMVSRMLSASPMEEGVRDTRVEYILKELKNLTRMDSVGLDRALRLIVDFMEGWCTKGNEPQRIKELQGLLKPLPKDDINS